jgi:ribonuclease R
MPLSSKKIIQTVNTFRDGQFSADDIIRALEEQSRSRFGGKKRAAPARSVKDIRLIHLTLADLGKAGYLSHAKKGYVINQSFPREGKLTVSKSSSTVSADGIDIIVRNEDLGSARDSDTVTVIITDCRKAALFGEVDKVISKSREIFFATVETKTKGLIIYRLMDIPGENFAALQRQAEDDTEQNEGDFASVRLVGRMIQGRQECALVERFAAASGKHDVDRIILRHNLPGEHKTYPDLITDIQALPESEKAKRKDYRKLLTVTIDGEYAKDFDDAVSFRKDGSRNILYVHIADVSAFVAKGSTLDREAERRGTSYYLGNRVVPMLPETLSNNLCSLRPDEDRLTLSAELTYDKEGNLVNSYFTRGIIRSDKRMTYAMTHELIEHPEENAISDMINEIYAFMMVLKKKRLARGRVDLQMQDYELLFEDGEFRDIVTAKRYRSHYLVEEAMLSANEAVSKVLREKQIPALYRVHEPMSMESLANLMTFLATFGVKIDKRKELGNSLQSAVEEVEGKPFAHVVSFVILRSMMQAFYGENPMGHFGLGFRDYTHFTSPIRRYPDLIVHRCLKSLIDGTEAPYTNEELAAIGLESSRLERIAQKAERDLFKLKSCRIMAERVGDVTDGIISGLSKYGIYVTLKDSPMEGMIPLRTVNDDFYVVSEDSFRAAGRRNGRTFTIGDTVTIRVVRADIVTMQIDFELIDNSGRTKNNETKSSHSRGKDTKHGRRPVRGRRKK